MDLYGDAVEYGIRASAQCEGFTADYIHLRSVALRLSTPLHRAVAGREYYNYIASMFTIVE
jgi:hypothetical protein